MALTSFTATRRGPTTEYVAESDTEGAVFYWYADWQYLGSSTDGRWRVTPDPDDLLDVDVVDSADEDFEPEDPDNVPQLQPARRAVEWTAAADTTDYYLVEQKKDAGDYAEVDRIAHAAGVWLYRWRSARLDDLAAYTWRVTPVDARGVAGTPITVGPVDIVRPPDPPDWQYAWEPSAITFSEP